MTSKYFFILFAIAQGALVLGLTVFIFYHYLPKTRADIKNRTKWHIVTVSISYILLIFATIKTAAFSIYEAGDVWYWLVSIAYVIGDISLLFVLKDSIKRQKKL